MAHSGFCTNEQLIKAILKRFKDMVVFLVSPEMLFLEEFIIFLKESLVIHGLSPTFVIESGKQKFKELAMCDKLRYIKLAEEINDMVLEA